MGAVALSHGLHCFTVCRGMEWWCTQSHANRSPLNISLFSGKLTGKFSIFTPWRRFHIGEVALPQRFFTKFPKKFNRVKLSDNRDRNRVNSEIQSRYQKRLFFTYFHLNFAGQNRLRAAAKDVSNEIRSPIRCDQALDPPIVRQLPERSSKRPPSYRSANSSTGAWA
jgi:hypothetical protein